MHPLVLSFTDGTTFFVGLALTLVAEILLVGFRKRVAGGVLSVFAIVGIILVLISATPLPIWAYSIWIIAAFVGLVLLNRAASPLKIRILSGFVLLASTAGLWIAEAPHHRYPRLTLAEGTKVYVLGDSISAGIDSEIRCWPDVLGELTSLRVFNLARPGETIEGAISQAKYIKQTGSLVIVEIGGNDLINQTDPSAFQRDLDSLLSLLRSDQHQVLIFEIPLFPFENAFGAAQRGAMSKHEVAVLPKRCLTKVLGTKNGTLDGLHLSPVGHEALATIIDGVIEQK